MTYPVIVFSVPRCAHCGKELNNENWKGWIEPSENILGITVVAAVCDECILYDDGSDDNGAY